MSRRNRSAARIKNKFTHFRVKTKKSLRRKPRPPHRQFKYCFSNFVLFTSLCLHIALSRLLARLVRGNGIGWDGTARMAFPMNDNECQNDNELWTLLNFKVYNVNEFCRFVSLFVRVVLSNTHYTYFHKFINFYWIVFWWESRRMGWDWHKLQWNGTEKYVPWTSLLANKAYYVCKEKNYIATECFQMIQGFLFLFLIVCLICLRRWTSHRRKKQSSNLQPANWTFNFCKFVLQFTNANSFWSNDFEMVKFCICFTVLWFWLEWKDYQIAWPGDSE